jgi:hypothetical protein
MKMRAVMHSLWFQAPRALKKRYILSSGNRSRFYREK